MSILFHATFDSDTTPRLVVEEDGEWRIDLGSKLGRKNIIDNLPDTGERLEYFLIARYRPGFTERTPWGPDHPSYDEMGQ